MEHNTCSSLAGEDVLHLLRGYDLDGVASTGMELQEPCVIVSGRLLDQYDSLAKNLAQKCPVYLRGSGRRDDHIAAGFFKAATIKRLGITEFHENHPLDRLIIRNECPDVTIVEYAR